MNAFSLVVTERAERLIRKKLRWFFWVRDPVILLVAEGAPGPEGAEAQKARQSGAGMKAILAIYRKYYGEDTIFGGKRLVIRIVSGRTFSNRGLLVRASGLSIWPHMKMIDSPSRATQWRIDVGDDGLVLLKDGVVVAGRA